MLRSQNEGYPQDERDAARARLNRSYDRFAAKYGPINKTSFSVMYAGTPKETEVRRMPNVARFREDPDAFLVLSLEEYDEGTGKAAKSAIMRQDVVGPANPVGKVETAEEGLLVSLNERGRIDLDHITSLYGKPPERIVGELGDLVFHDPETDEHVTRDEYLSGNVRKKLAVAAASTDPRHRRNAEALLAVQPEDLLPGDIDANLGAPWIPVPYIEQFAAQLLEAAPSSITVHHLPERCNLDA